ncbi:MAG: hypothetical protein HY718_17780, partial [Planctomycetes bacterium]|nr:hypothetical protein [Planctomycetota bacterium]
MRTVKLMGLMALLAGGMAYGASQVVYTVETGGNNQSTLWEANQAPSFLSGVTDGSTTLTQGQNLTWAVRVSCGGLHENPGGAGDGSVGFGAANLVFDLQVYEADGTTPVILDAAPLGCDPGGTGVPGTPGVKNCAPTGKGYWSSINDGDQDGSRGTILNAPDLLANAAFAIAIHNQSSAPAQLRSLIDPVSPTPSGPNFDYGWYPTGNGRGGIDIAGTKTISTTVSGLSGLVGFGAGMKSYEFTNYRPGVGRFRVIGLTPGFGANIGSDPLNPTADERPLFEGQINTTGLAPATYVLKVIPSADGTNIIHGNVVWNSTTADYGGFGSFAVKANQVHALPAAGVAFTVNPPEAVTEIVARKLFYNQSFYDGNKVAIDPAPIAGANNDDADAIDNGGLFATVNWP